MLSSENPSPDLPCSPENSQLKRRSDERASDNINEHQFDEEVDLFKSGLDDNTIYPLPNFSIRDYVFSTRGKDIKNNWPFSQKNLQLCLEYGVNDVLPPFDQSPDSVRNPKHAAENLSYFDGKLSELSNHTVAHKSAVDIQNINSSGSEKDKEFPSTTASQSCFDTNSVPPLESPSDNPEFTVRASKKVVRNIQNTVKKCRLIVKSNNTTAEQKPNGDLAVTTCLISETMASKVCPVCKTFSSSSNTTLNAHIDQCLSGESTVKWTTNSKVIKHRIKPRKTRLVVDIYETALHCTLEDLDRRNGTNWASSNLGFPADQDLEACVVEKNKLYSSVDIEGVVKEDGDVYVDSNGTKLRILSKLSDVPSSSNASYDCGPSKLVERDKGNKFLPSKKKKYLVQKEKLLDHCLYEQGSYSPGPDRVLKCPPYGQKGCYSRPDHCSEPEVKNGQQNKPEVCEDVTQPRVAYEQMKSDDLGMIKQWVGSRRTGLREKTNLEHESRHPDKLKKNLRIKSGVLSLGDDTLVKRNSASKPLISSDKNPLSATESHKRKKNLLSNNPHDGCIEQPCSRKRPGISLLKARDKNNHLEFSKFNVKQSRHECHTDPPNGVESHVSSRNDKKMGISVCPAVNNDCSFVRSRMSQHHTFSSEAKDFSSLEKTSLGRAIPSGSTKFSSLRKKLFSVRHASVPESKKKMRQKHLDFKKRRLGENEAQIYRQGNLVETLGENEARMGKASSKSLINKTRVLKIQKTRGGFVNAGKGDKSLKVLETSPKSDSHGGVGKNIDSFIPDDTYNVKIHDGFVCEPSYDGEAFAAFSKSLDSAFPGATAPNVECVSQHYNKSYEGHCQAELVLGGEQDMFCADEVGKDLVSHNSHEVAEMNTGEEAQRNYYVDVDPIPIPGPPGSFLPSPGRMGSEELQGNSSLTTCRIQSSEDEREVVDMDSSDSPISAMSVVSNSFAPRSDSPSVVNLSVQSHVRQILPEKKPTPEPEKIATNSSMGYDNSDTIMLTACGDCESPTPSTSYPVLRLMGKNLMVVNKDENRSPPQTRLITQSSIGMMENPGPRLCVDNNGLLSTSNNIHYEPHSFHRILSGGPSVLENTQTSMPAQHFDCNSSEYGFKVPANFRPLQMSVHPSTVLLSSKSFGGNFTSSLKRHQEYASGCNLIISNEIGSNIRLDTRTTYDDNIEIVRTPISHVDSSGSKQKEIIVIDDSLAGLAIKATDSRVNPFYGYQTRGYPLCAGSPIFRNGNKQVPFSKGMNANLGKWINCTAEGSSILRPNSLTASLPSAVHPRSSLYFSPGFS